MLLSGGAIVASAVLDKSLLYNEWIWTPINFLRVNVLEGISLFYGSSPWHWYLSQGLPILFGVYIPLVLIGSYRAFQANTGLNAALKQQVLYLSLWVVFVYSALQHKEWRFLYPILYPLLPFAADTVQRLFLSSTDWKRSKSRVAVLMALVIVNGIMAWYTTLVHQRGVVDVMNWVRETSRGAGSHGQDFSFGFIMPCHSTPWYNSIHLRDAKPLPMWFITCSPPLGYAFFLDIRLNFPCFGSIDALLLPSSQVPNLYLLLSILHREVDPTTYKDESDIFYEDPVAFMDNLFKERSPTTGTLKESHLVLFEDLITTFPDMRVWFGSQGYHEVNANDMRFYLLFPRIAGFMFFLCALVAVVFCRHIFFYLWFDLIHMFSFLINLVRAIF